MNQGKSDVIKQMTRLNINILGIRELKWMSMGQLIQMTIISATLGKKWSSPHSQQNSPRCSTWVQHENQQNDLGSFPRQTIWHHSNPRLCPNHWCWKSWSWLVLWRPTTPSRMNTKKDVLFIIGGWNANVESQEIPGLPGKFSLGVRNKAGQKLIEFCQESTLVIANTHFQQHETTLHRNTTRWSILKSDLLYSLQSKMEKF